MKGNKHFSTQPVIILFVEVSFISKAQTMWDVTHNRLILQIPTLSMINNKPKQALLIIYSWQILTNILTVLTIFKAKQYQDYKAGQLNAY